MALHAAFDTEQAPFTFYNDKCRRVFNEVTLLGTDDVKQNKPKGNIRRISQFKTRTKQKLYREFDLNCLERASNKSKGQPRTSENNPPAS